MILQVSSIRCTGRNSFKKKDYLFNHLDCTVSLHVYAMLGPREPRPVAWRAEEAALPLPDWRLFTAKRLSGVPSALSGLPPDLWEGEAAETVSAALKRRSGVPSDLRGTLSLNRMSGVPSFFRCAPWRPEAACCWLRAVEEMPRPRGWRREQI